MRKGGREELRGCNNIEKLRKEGPGLSRSELSRVSGVPYRTIECWEYWERVPRDCIQLHKVAVVLGCTIEDLINFDVIEKITKEPLE